MGLFRRDDDDAPTAAATAPAAAPPHPALASLEAFAAAPLDQAASAILVLAFSGEEHGSSLRTSQVTQRAQDLLGPATGLKGTKLLMHFQDMDLQTVINEGVDVLQRSLLVYLLHTSNATPEMVLTRRGRRALDSGAPERWVDVPADPV